MVKALLAVLLVLFGYFLGSYVNPLDTAPINGDFVFSREINIVEIVSALTPIMVGLLVAQYFHRPSNRRLLVTQTLVEQIKQLDSHLEALANEARENNLQHSVAVAFSKKCKHSIEDIFKKIGEHKVNVTNSSLRTFQVKFHNLRKPLTDVPRQADASNSSSKNRVSPPLSIDNGICKYSQLRISELDKYVADIRADLLTLILDVHGDS